GCVWWRGGTSGWEAGGGLGGAAGGGRRGYLIAQFAFGDDPLGDVLDQRDRADDRSVVDERLDPCGLRHLGEAGAVEIAGNRQQEPVKALGENPDFTSQRVAVIAIDAAVGECRIEVQQRAPDHLLGPPSGLRGEPPVPSPDDQTIVGNQHPAVVELFEPLFRGGIQRVFLSGGGHGYRCVLSQSSTARISRSSDATLSTIIRYPVTCVSRR